MVVLTLGPVRLEGFEVPSRLRFGGAQALAVHKLPGGARVIDAMGRDDADLVWSGILSGPDAGGRTRLLDSLRANGAVLRLAWDAFCYSVIIARLDLDYSNPWWITYRIVCTVLADEAQGAPAAEPDITLNVLDDLGLASSFFGLAAAIAAVATSGALISGSQANQSASALLSSAASGISSGITSAETGLQGDDIAALVGSSQSLAQLCCAQGFVDRAAANFSYAEE